MASTNPASPFYLSNPRTTRFITAASTPVNFEQQVDSFQQDLSKEVRKLSKKYKKKGSLTSFLGGIHNVEELVMDVKRADAMLKKRPAEESSSDDADDCTLRNAVTHPGNWKRKVMWALDNQQLRSFSLHPHGALVLPRVAPAPSSLPQEVKAKRGSAHGKKRVKSTDRNHNSQQQISTTPRKVLASGSFKVGKGPGIFRTEGRDTGRGSMATRTQKEPASPNDRKRKSGGSSSSRASTPEEPVSPDVTPCMIESLDGLKLKIKLGDRFSS